MSLANQSEWGHVSCASSALFKLQTQSTHRTGAGAGGRGMTRIIPGLRTSLRPGTNGPLAASFDHRSNCKSTNGVRGVAQWKSPGLASTPGVSPQGKEGRGYGGGVTFILLFWINNYCFPHGESAFATLSVSLSFFFPALKSFWVMPKMAGWCQHSDWGRRIRSSRNRFNHRRSLGKRWNSAATPIPYPTPMFQKQEKNLYFNLQILFVLKPIMFPRSTQLFKSFTFYLMVWIRSEYVITL